MNAPDHMFKIPKTLSLMEVSAHATAPTTTDNHSALLTRLQGRRAHKSGAVTQFLTDRP